MGKFQDMCDALHRKPINQSAVDTAISDAERFPEEFPTEKRSKKPLGPGEDADPEKHQTSEPVPSGLPGSEKWNPPKKAKDKNAEYEAEYSNLNSAMAAHKKSPSEETVQALKKAEANYSAARKKALYQKDPNAN